MRVNHKYLELAKEKLGNFSKSQLIKKYREIEEESEGKYAKGTNLSLSPTNEEEANQYGNMLANNGNYPAGLSGCFCVGISGNCGYECYVLNEGKCQNFLEVATSDEVGKEKMEELYQKGFYKLEIETLIRQTLKGKERRKINERIQKNKDRN